MLRIPPLPTFQADTLENDIMPLDYKAILFLYLFSDIIDAFYIDIMQVGADSTLEMAVLVGAAVISFRIARQCDPAYLSAVGQLSQIPVDCRFTYGRMGLLYQQIQFVNCRVRIVFFYGVQDYLALHSIALHVGCSPHLNSFMPILYCK